MIVLNLVLLYGVVVGIEEDNKTHEQHLQDLAPNRTQIEGIFLKVV